MHVKSRGMHGHGREHDFVATLIGAKSIAQQIVLFREAIDDGPGRTATVAPRIVNALDDLKGLPQKGCRRSRPGAADLAIINNLVAIIGDIDGLFTVGPNAQGPPVPMRRAAWTPYPSRIPRSIRTVFAARRR
jgi:hypothetical protein